jgi:hypothetical protein
MAIFYAHAFLQFLSDARTLGWLNAENDIVPSQHEPDPQSSRTNLRLFSFCLSAAWRIPKSAESGLASRLSEHVRDGAQFLRGLACLSS